MKTGLKVNLERDSGEPFHAPFIPWRRIHPRIAYPNPTMYPVTIATSQNINLPGRLVPCTRPLPKREGRKSRKCKDLVSLQTAVRDSGAGVNSS